MKVVSYLLRINICKGRIISIIHDYVSLLFELSLFPFSSGSTFYPLLSVPLFSLPGVSQVEVLIAISSVTSPLLFSASGFLSSSVISFIEIFLHDVPTAKVNVIKRESSCNVQCAGFTHLASASFSTRNTLTNFIQAVKLTDKKFYSD